MHCCLGSLFCGVLLARIAAALPSPHPPTLCCSLPLLRPQRPPRPGGAAGLRAAADAGDWHGEPGQRAGGVGAGQRTEEGLGWLRSRGMPACRPASGPASVLPVSTPFRSSSLHLPSLLQGRLKSLYSTFKKMARKQVGLLALVACCVLRAACTRPSPSPAAAPLHHSALTPVATATSPPINQAGAAEGGVRRSRAARGRGRRRRQVRERFGAPLLLSLAFELCFLCQAALSPTLPLPVRPALPSRPPAGARPRPSRPATSCCLLCTVSSGGWRERRTTTSLSQRCD